MWFGMEMRRTRSCSGSRSILHTMVSLPFSRMSTGILSWLLLFSWSQYLTSVGARQIGSSAGESVNLLAAESSSKPVELAWGISETQAQLGKLFNFSIPKDAFDGKILDIKVTEVDHKTLPTWLIFNPKTRLFIGLPFHSRDLGEHYISVTVLGSQDTSAKDVFSISVKESIGEIQCASQAAQTLLTLMLDVDWEAITIPGQIALLSKFSNYMDIPVNDLKVSPMTGSSSSSLFDSSALIAGPGNAKEVKNPGIKLSSVVGCDGNLDGNHNRELATFVEEAAKDGSMARFTGVDVVGWHLTTSKPVPQPRLRRQSWLNTPEPSPIIPTIAVHGGSSVHGTPYLPATAAIDSSYGAADGIHSTVSYYPGIHPSSVWHQQVSPTAYVDQSATTPLLIVPPPMPPSKPTRKPEEPVQNLPPAEGKPFTIEGMPIKPIAGELFIYPIPSDIWSDPDSSYHNVSIREQNESELNWLDVSNEPGNIHVLTGVPLPEAKGIRKYHLDISDGTNTLHVPFDVDVQVKVQDDVSAGYNHELEVTLNENIADFRHSRRVQFIRALQSYYEDPNADFILLRSVKPGSTHVSWLNESLNHKDCNDTLINDVAKRVVDGDMINPQFQTHFAKNNFKVDKAALHRIGRCAPGAAAERTTGNDILISTIVPAVVVSSLLLLACCIACILYRKRRRGKMSTEHETIFKGQNKPVILAGENYDNHSKGNNGASKKPTILEEERGGTLPPAYSNRNNRGPGATNQAHLDAEDRQDVPLLSMRPVSPNPRDGTSPHHQQPSSKLILVSPSHKET